MMQLIFWATIITGFGFRYINGQEQSTIECKLSNRMEGPEPSRNASGCGPCFEGYSPPSPGSMEPCMKVTKKAEEHLNPPLPSHAKWTAVLAPVVLAVGLIVCLIHCAIDKCNSSDQQNSVAKLEKISDSPIVGNVNFSTTPSPRNVKNDTNDHPEETKNLLLTTKEGLQQKTQVVETKV